MPVIIQQMNYGCGSTVNSRDLMNDSKNLYFGVGGGMELLQFAMFKKEFEDLRKSDALNLPLRDNCIDVAVQNYLFNFF